MQNTYLFYEKQSLCNAMAVIEEKEKTNVRTGSTCIKNTLKITQGKHEQSQNLPVSSLSKCFIYRFFPSLLKDLLFH